MRDLESNRTLANAKDLAERIYTLTDRLPRSETYGLASQSQRAAVSIAANVAEGLGRGTPGELTRFLRIASGSAAELSVLLEMIDRIHRISDDEVTEALDHIRRQLIRFIRTVHADRPE